MARYPGRHLGLRDRRLPVLRKWLSYREQRVLGRDITPAEARHFTAMARRITATRGRTHTVR
jgi:hypothetical protein